MTFSANRGASSARTVLVLLTSMALAVALLPPLPVTEAGNDLQVIVTATDGLAATASDVVQDVGGSIGTELGLIGSVSATVPAAALDTLRAEPAIASAVVDAPLQLTTAGWDDATKVKFNPSTYEGTVNRVGGSILQVDAYWAQGYDGSGVDVALIDSGVAPVNGLTYPGKIINGPDLSFEPQSDVFRHLDTFGHGTHMAGIIAGRDDGASTDDNLAFLGVAPGSRIVSVKVADEDGATDVSQVIAAIDWVVQHRNDDGLNIGVINLSFGTDSTQSYQLDPLAYAVEQAWKAGIVVVVAAGNDGNDAALRNPATDPFVIAVGATNSATTRPKVTSVLDFSNCGTSDRFVDVVVPGESIASLRVPGSNADDNNPQSVVAERYMLGSGTSQAAAFVSGTAALIIDRNPEATPDQVKALLMRNAGDRFRQTDALCVGAGLPNLEWVRNDIQSDGLPVAAQSYSASTGLGLLEDARGADHLENDSAILEGEQDIFGNAWDGTSWSTAAALGTSWSGGDWNGTSWSGSSWSGSSWSGTSWSGTSWSGSSWSGSSWSDTSWSDKFWSGTSWSGSSWSGSSWSGTSWSGLSWGQRPD